MSSPEPSSPTTSPPDAVAGSVSRPEIEAGDVVATSHHALNLEQQVDELLEELDATQRKVETVIEEPAKDVEADLATLESAVDEARAKLSEQERIGAAGPANRAVAGAGSTPPEMAGIDALDASLAEQELMDAPQEERQDERPDEQLSEQLSEQLGDQPNDLSTAGEPDSLDDLLEDSPAATPDNFDNLLDDVDAVGERAEDGEQSEEEILEEAANEDPLAEAKESFVNQWLAPESASPEALAAQDAAIEEAIKSPDAARKSPADPAQAEELLADLDRAIAETASEMIAAEAPATRASKPVAAGQSRGGDGPQHAAADPAVDAPASLAGIAAQATPKAKSAGHWIWSRLEPKLLKGAALLDKPLAKKPAATRHALGLVGLYTLVVAGACWGWVVFLRPSSIAGGPVEPFNFQKSGLPGPDLHAAHHAHGADTQPSAPQADKGGEHGGGDAKDGKDKKKPVLNSGDGKSVINKTMDDRAKKAKEAAKGGKGEAKKSGGH